MSGLIFGVSGVAARSWHGLEYQAVYEAAAPKKTSKVTDGMRPNQT
jgi:hypothetical protein